jgi:glutathione S-transferase
VLTWHFWLANTLHPPLRVLFYDEALLPGDQSGPLIARTRERVAAALDVLEGRASSLGRWLGAERSSLLDCYLCPMLRWLAVYPVGTTDWFDLKRWPRLQAVAARMDSRPETLAAAVAEGLGTHPFTRPTFPSPPEGTPL